MDLEILTFLSAGGDVATMGLCIALWRFDRRILRMETLIECMQLQQQTEQTT